MQRFNYATNGYQFDKLIFYGCLVAIIGLSVYIGAQFNFDFHQRYYVKCPYGNCENPFYAQKGCEYDWCTKYTLTAGEYGEKIPESFLWKYYVYIDALILALSVALNHLVHNRGNKFQWPEPLNSFLKFKIEDDQL